MSSSAGADPVNWQYAVHIRPLITQRDNKMWRAQYPELDWYVTADSKEAAGAKINEEALRRLDAGEPDAQPPHDILERHLANPIPGVYALDRELFVYLREEGERSELDKAFEEAERRRALGQTYTKADYLKSLQSPGGEA
jgi:hypothetical protein